MAVCRFDDSLPWLAQLIAAELGIDALVQGVVLREASGRLAFFSAKSFDESTTGRLLETLTNRLGSYLRPDRAIALPDAPGAQAVLSDNHATLIEVEGLSLRYLDRRIVGADWLRRPEAHTAIPPRFVFASLKGGVGRSTALSIVAAEEAQAGRNVLVIDLDLEAPGVGSMLLSEDRLPKYGALDFLVEQNLEIPAEVDECVGTSGLTQGKGLVDVVPVVGTRSGVEPRNFLAKLSRAMLEGTTASSDPLTLPDKIRSMLETFEQRSAYDIVLIDARAGLAELAAGPLLALGANILLFGTAQRQTLEGLRYLFAHLQTLVQPDQESPWRPLKMIHAKAQHAAAHELFRDQLWELFAEYLYESEESAGLEVFNFSGSDPDAPHNPIPIPNDLAFADWNPVDAPQTLVRGYYERAFGPLLAYVKSDGDGAVL